MTPSKNAIDSPDEPCPECGWIEAWELVRCRNQGGHWQHFFMCHCGFRQTRYLPKKLVKGSGLSVREVEPKRARHRCEKCGADGAESHHWAPRHIFGDEADLWPVSFLCPTCYQRWHDLMTLGASRTPELIGAEARKGEGRAYPPPYTGTFPVHACSMWGIWSPGMPLNLKSSEITPSATATACIPSCGFRLSYADMSASPWMANPGPAID